MKASPSPSKALIDFSRAYEYLAPAAFRLCVWLDGRSYAEAWQSNPPIMQKLDQSAPPKKAKSLSEES